MNSNEYHYVPSTNRLLDTSLTADLDQQDDDLFISSNSNHHHNHHHHHKKESTLNDDDDSLSINISRSSSSESGSSSSSSKSSKNHHNGDYIQLDSFNHHHHHHHQNNLLETLQTPLKLLKSNNFNLSKRPQVQPVVQDLKSEQQIDQQQQQSPADTKLSIKKLLNLSKQKLATFNLNHPTAASVQQNAELPTESRSNNRRKNSTNSYKQIRNHNNHSHENYNNTVTTMTNKELLKLRANNNNIRRLHSSQSYSAAINPIYDRKISFLNDLEINDKAADLVEDILENQNNELDSLLIGRENTNNGDSKINFLSKSFEDDDKYMNKYMSNENRRNSTLSPSDTSSSASSSSNNSKIKHPLENMEDEINVVIIDSNKAINAASGDKKRHDSIRMRHHSNANINELNSNLINSTSLINMSGLVNEETVQLTNNNNTNNAINANSSQDSLSENKEKLYKLKKKNFSSIRHKKHNYLVIFILFVVNLLNYIDRFTLAGVLLDIQKYFDINDSQSGLLQTVFICSYMLLAPLFGYLGDRYSRKWIIIFGISFWSLMTLLGSFVPRDMFWLFVLIRSLVGIGEASYSCVAPTIIGDLFTSEMRTKMLAVFYLAVPVGSGMGYIVGSNVAKAFDNWQWALRVTPPLGFLSILALVMLVKEPKRGQAEGQLAEESKSSMLEDCIYLLKNKTFMWITFGFTFASFVLGGLSWWVPLYVQFAIYSNNQTPEQIPLIFGIITVFSGLIGVTLSSILASKFRSKTPHADPLICALGSLIAVPSLFILVLITRTANAIVFWFIAAIAISAMCLSWTIVADILLYAVYPTKRSIASALNILICHLFGDAGSPYVIGIISDYLRSGKPDTYYNKFTSLQAALYAGPFFAALSFAAYLFAAIYVDDDRKRVDALVRQNQKKYNDSKASLNLNSTNNLICNENKDDDMNIDIDLQQKLNSSKTTSSMNKSPSGGFANPLLNESESTSETNSRLNIQNQQQDQELVDSITDIPIFNSNSASNLLSTTTNNNHHHLHHH